MRSFPNRLIRFLTRQQENRDLIPRLPRGARAPWSPPVPPAQSELVQLLIGYLIAKDEAQALKLIKAHPERTLDQWIARHGFKTKRTGWTLFKWRFGQLVNRLMR